MSLSRTYLLPLSLSSVVVLAGALGQQPAPPAQPPSPAPAFVPPKPDPAAQKILDDALLRLDRKRLEWVETILWQQMAVQGLTFQAEGIYLAGPNQRLHLNLKVQLGDNVGRMQIVCDGTTLWETMQAGSGERRLTRKMEVAKVLETLQNPDVREAFFHSLSFAGVRPLVQSLQQRMTFTRHESTHWKNHAVHKLTASWSPKVLETIAPPDKQEWPAFLPRHCQLYLDAQTGWPHRLEWWGPTQTRADDVLILQVEFRNPKFDAMSPERCAKVFTFHPGPGEVADVTRETIQAFGAQQKQK